MNRLCLDSLRAGLLTDIQLFHFGIGQLIHYLFLQQLACVGSQQIAVIELAADLNGVAILHFQLFQRFCAGNFLHIQLPLCKVVMAVHAAVHLIAVLILYQEENVGNIIVGAEGSAADILYRGLPSRQVGNDLCLADRFCAQKFLKGKGDIVLIVELLEGHFHIKAALGHELITFSIQFFMPFTGGIAALVAIEDRALFAVDLIGAFLVDHLGLRCKHTHMATVYHTVSQMGLGVGLIHHLFAVVFTNVQAGHIIILVIAEFLNVLRVGIRTNRNTVVHLVQLKGIA